MSSYGTILGVLAPVFLIIGAGYALRRGRVLTVEADASLMRLVVQVLYPALIFRYVAGNPALAQTANVILPPLLGFCTIVLGFAVAYASGPWIGLRIGHGRRSFAYSIGIYNFGYIPIPLVAALFADDATMGVLFMFNVGIELALWTVGILLLTGTLNRAWAQKILNPPVIALLLGLACNATGIGATLPGWLLQLLRMTGDCAIPLALLLAGATLAELRVGIDIFRPFKVPLAACGLRLVLLPAAFVLMALLLPGLGEELRRVLVVQAAMPAGVFTIVLARHYGGEPRVAVQVICATTLLSLFTIPFWIAWGLRWLG
jgi:hypothetical protein